ncbi:unnamed protein product [Didymodactylos carnosus]|uniref:C2H2-type domain-containing protein n=1 Tax=Didymodactylos carnosus TaxID=1234261 RepID=A0A815PFP6_9BILA|nr:unnamed protein product [Didymodactylos carnosus]CAF4322391.1 unnamed protein product [Didymodactylos carnosus]
MQEPSDYSQTQDYEESADPRIPDDYSSFSFGELNSDPIISSDEESTDTDLEGILDRLDSDGVSSYEEDEADSHRILNICKQCGEAFSERINLLLHVKIAHTGNIPLFICWQINQNGSFCGKWYTRKFARLVHSLESHNHCPDCDTQFTCLEDSNQHRRAKHSRKKKSKHSLAGITQTKANSTKSLDTANAHDITLQNLEDTAIYYKKELPEEGIPYFVKIDKNPLLFIEEIKELKSQGFTKCTIRPSNLVQTDKIISVLGTSLDLLVCAESSLPSVSQLHTDTKSRAMTNWRKELLGYNLRGKKRLTAKAQQNKSQEEAPRKERKHHCAYAADDIPCSNSFTRSYHKRRHEINSHFFCSLCNTKFNSRQLAFEHYITKACSKEN